MGFVCPENALRGRSGAAADHRLPGDGLGVAAQVPARIHLTGDIHASAAAATTAKSEDQQSLEGPETDRSAGRGHPETVFPRRGPEADEHAGPAEGLVPGRRAGLELSTAGHPRRQSVDGSHLPRGADDCAGQRRRERWRRREEVRQSHVDPRFLPDDHKTWEFLAQHLPLTAAEVRQKLIITEISRTDRTKRKDVLIKAFARVHEQYPDTMLAVSIDETEEELEAELKELIRRHHVEDHTAILGYVWDELPDLYAVTAVYCSPSVMEGFGMSVQEAAATKVPVVASDLIPFVKEYLLGDETIQISYDGMDDVPMLQGGGAFVVRADDVDGFAEALDRLVDDENLRREMGERAYDITLPYFTWKNMTARFIETVKKVQRAHV